MYNWISRLFTSLLCVVGWTSLYLFKILSRFSCARAYLVYSGDLTLIDTVEEFFQLLSLCLGVQLLIFQVIHCFLCFLHQLRSCFSKTLFCQLVIVPYIITPEDFSVFSLQCIPTWYLQLLEALHWLWAETEVAGLHQNANGPTSELGLQGKNWTVHLWTSIRNIT